MFAFLVRVQLALGSQQLVEQLLLHRVQLALRACTQFEWLRLFVNQLRFCVSWYLLVKNINSASIKGVSAVDGGASNAC